MPHCHCLIEQTTCRCPIPWCPSVDCPTLRPPQGAGPATPSHNRLSSHAWLFSPCNRRWVRRGGVRIDCEEPVHPRPGIQATRGLRAFIDADLATAHANQG